MTEPNDQPVATPATRNPRKWQHVWFIFHLATVYLLAKVCTPWLAGWTHGQLLPFSQIPTASSAWEFIYSHVLVFSVIPALGAGFVNARFRHRSAIFVWVIPAAILAYKMATFSYPHSVLYNPSSSPMLHYYFGGGFFIPAFHNWRELWNAAGSNPDMARGMAQLTFTSPFYAGLAYSLSAWASMRWNLTIKAGKKVEQWEDSRFGSRHELNGNEASTATSHSEIHGTTDPSET